MMKTNDPQNLSDRLHETVVAEASLIHEQLKALHLNVQQARLLQFVAAHPGCLQKEAAHYLGRQDATVTNMLKSLVQAGYLRREVPAENERVKQLYIAPAGQKLIDQITTIFSDLEDKVRAAVPADERKALARNLDRIKAALEE
ncbi:MarR family winged helix-turn-helix transcriptional regulator [Lacticaseibacillus mingshuiensis]|nr:MarR family winged helix-turn-helix transcriptional regulator [Lacticaseibacillus mingshuiensis]